MAKARRAQGPDGSVYVNFKCPGCDGLHSVCVEAGTKYVGPVWNWNLSLEEPTIAPSVLLWLEHRPDETEEEKTYANSRRCHSFVRDGRIEFLLDCGHALAGQTVDLPTVK